ncbi:MAG: ABC transporter permease [Gammaproteobacteria bacterium]|nr:ABC transporter permease [Gammaproteobacteria bacterium]
MLGQVLEVTLMNLRNVRSRLGSSSVIVVGISCVVGVLIALLAMAAGFRATLETGGAPDRAIVMRDGSESEMLSNVSPNDRFYVSTFAGIDAASAELYTVADVPKRDTGLDANLIVRGVEAEAFEVRPEVRIVEGRNFVPGRAEIIAGRNAQSEFAGLDIGNSLEFRNSEWTVVGVFEDGGSAHESEIWVDLAVAQSAFRRGGTVSSLRLRVDSPASMDALRARVEDDKQLDLKLVPEEEYLAAQASGLATTIELFGTVVAYIMAVGAVFAALNTMYSAVVSRTVEIATLRALGFGGLPVVVSVMIEAIALAFIGGLLGAAIAWFGFNGYTVSTLNNASFSQIAFDFAVTPELMTNGLIWALVLGTIGGLFPAVRAARLPITTALRGE